MISKIDPAGLDVGQIGGRRNLIINGGQTVNQRGDQTGLTSTGFACDRFQFAASGTIGTYSLAQSTTAPDGFGYSLKLDTTTADASPTGTDNLTIRYKIEGQDLQGLAFGTSAAKSITLSFWCRSNKTGNFQVNIRNQDASRMISSVVTISAADTWEFKELTFAGDTTSGFNNDNGESLRIEWFLDVGPDWSSGTAPTTWESTSAGDLGAGVTLALADNTANEFYITGVQLEVGDTATPFEHRSYGEELALCQRYCIQMNGTEYTFMGMADNASRCDMSAGLPVAMRAVPALEFSGTASDYKVRKAGTTVDCTADPQLLSDSNTHNVFLRFVAAVSVTTGEALRGTSGSNGFLRFDAEL